MGKLFRFEVCIVGYIKANTGNIPLHPLIFFIIWTIDKSLMMPTTVRRIFSLVSDEEGLKKLDQLHLRFRWPLEWRKDIPDFPVPRCLCSQAVFLPDDDSRTSNPHIAFLGGAEKRGCDWDVFRGTKNVCSLEFGSQQNPLWHCSSLPDMNVPRAGFGVSRNGNKIYSFGGADMEDTFEVLDLKNLQSGWSTFQMPLALKHLKRCQAVGVGTKHIYVLATDNVYVTKFCSYDTKSCTWDMLPNPINSWKFNFRMTSICVHGEGTYIILLGGKTAESVDAFHVESKSWMEIDGLPEIDRRNSCMIASVENRYIIVAGGHGRKSNRRDTASMFALDWTTKQWIELPSLPQVQSGAAGVFTGGFVNKLFFVRGFNLDDLRFVPSASLDVSYGIGWAKEKLLVLCFKRKAQEPWKKKQGPCLLESLPSEIFAKILQYLFVPFQNEIKCERSIFAEMLDASSSLILSEKRRTDIYQTKPNMN